jgi:small subunit ribosomal protein S1
MDYGAFVDLGGRGRAAARERDSHRRGHKPSEFVKVGDSIDVKVLKIDREAGKLSLSSEAGARRGPVADASTKYASARRSPGA